MRETPVNFPKRDNPITNPSTTDPLVILQLFGPENPDLVVTA